MKSETLTFNGTTIVDGITVEVVLTVNTVQLIHKLGDKAARNRGRKARLGSGLITVTADKAGNQAVREAAALKRKARKADMAARQARWDAERAAEEAAG
jgi:hypothetical protein